MSIAESFDDVMELTIKEKCTVTNIDCLETIVDHYNIENARPHIITYKSSVDEICKEFRKSVLDVTTVSSSFKYESIMLVLGWQRIDDLTLNDINSLLSKAFGDITSKVSFQYGLKSKWIKNEKGMLSNLKNLATCNVWWCVLYNYIYLACYIKYFSFYLIYNGIEAIDNCIVNQLCLFY